MCKMSLLVSFFQPNPFTDRGSCIWCSLASCSQPEMGLKLFAGRICNTLKTQEAPGVQMYEGRLSQNLQYMANVCGDFSYYVDTPPNYWVEVFLILLILQHTKIVKITVCFQPCANSLENALFCSIKTVPCEQSQLHEDMVWWFLCGGNGVNCTKSWPQPHSHLLDELKC